MGEVTVGGPIVDEDFELTQENAIKLSRHVEVYQW